MIRRKLFFTSSSLLIVAGLATFVFFILVYIFFGYIIINKNPRVGPASRPGYTEEFFILDDPYITKVPGLDDLITKPIINKNDPWLGASNATIVIVIFSDYICTYCQVQEKVIKQILNDYEGRVKIIWKDYPEASRDSMSWQAAVAARCAKEQGVYWEYHDLLYKGGEDINEDFILRLANLLSVDIDQFVNCLEDEDIESLIKKNIKEAEALGIRGVPYIFINDEAMLGEVTYDELKQIVEIELDKIK